MDRSEYSQRESDESYMYRHNAVAVKHFHTLYYIKEYIRKGLYDAAHESWEEIPHEDQIILNRAYTKGGLFTPQERSIAVKGLDTATRWDYGLGRVRQEIEPEL